MQKKRLPLPCTILRRTRGRSRRFWATCKSWYKAPWELMRASMKRPLDLICRQRLLESGHIKHTSFCLSRLNCQVSDSASLMSPDSAACSTVSSSTAEWCCIFCCVLAVCLMPDRCRVLTLAQRVLPFGHLDLQALACKCSAMCCACTAS